MRRATPAMGPDPPGGRSDRFAKERVRHLRAGRWTRHDTPASYYVGGSTSIGRVVDVLRRPGRVWILLGSSSADSAPTAFTGGRSRRAPVLAGGAALRRAPGAGGRWPSSRRRLRAR